MIAPEHEEGMLMLRNQEVAAEFGLRQRAQRKRASVLRFGTPRSSQTAATYRSQKLNLSWLSPYQSNSPPATLTTAEPKAKTAMVFSPGMIAASKNLSRNPPVKLS